MSSRESERAELRRLALIATGASVAFAVLAPLIGAVDTAGVVFDRYRSAMMPAGFTFAIWIVIDAALIAYAVAIRKHARLSIAGHDHLARLVIAASVLGPLWMIAFRFDQIGVSVVLMIAMLVVAIAMFVGAHDLCRRERACGVWTVPFALYLGWIGVSLLINLDVWLVSFGWRGAGLGETALAIAMIGLATVVGIATALRFADPVVAMTVAWAMAGIWIGQRTVDLGVGMAAFAGGAACVLGTAMALVRSALEARRDHAPTRVPEARLPRGRVPRTVSSVA
jgi:translocator protein